MPIVQRPVLGSTPTMDLDPMASPQENVAWRIIVVNAVFNLITLVVVSLRIYSRKITKVGFGYDDGFTWAAVVLVNVMLMQAAFLISLDFGYHISYIGEGNIESIFRLLLAFRVSFIFLITFVKLSALSFYLRVFVGPVWWLANFILEFAICHGPNQRFCPPRQYMDIAVCVFNAVGDVVILLLLVPPIWKLQMKKNTKVGLTVIFTLGLATLAIALLRFDAIIGTDYTFDIAGTAMASLNYAILEPNLAILCISLPILKPVYRKLQDRVDIIANRLSSKIGFRRASSSETLHDAGPSPLAAFELEDLTRRRGSSLPRVLTNRLDHCMDQIATHTSLPVPPIRTGAKREVLVGLSAHDATNSKMGPTEA
ncbi:Uu.00g140290.m01.CDS01 [Anthostomella pinea]|uniref:Uu.00g140290.m01.CDS01 n=1 Tax=Anthostomella pinea TaxID=933095 RepID=A0AAI8YL89_9PEZI|nr:Uu.00g140290.m01.CDS01 [Anthostomella pinea]